MATQCSSCPAEIYDVDTAWFENQDRDPLCMACFELMHADTWRRWMLTLLFKHPDLIMKMRRRVVDGEPLELWQQALLLETILGPTRKDPPHRPGQNPCAHGNKPMECNACALDAELLFESLKEAHSLERQPRED